ncbi:MAG: hypothetical protein M3297_10020 [Thermoproteota archaeon]|nr:hypothetical protein [Thermoproteota archaeon]
MLTDEMKELRVLDRDLAKMRPGFQDNNTKDEVYYRILNTVDWLSFLVNTKMVSDEGLIRRIEPVVVRYYEDIYLDNEQLGEKMSNTYQDLEELYRKIKK